MLPRKTLSDALFSNFFDYESWRFSLPRALFSNAYMSMWEYLQDDSNSADPVSIGWLNLLYAIFATNSRPLVQDTAELTNSALEQTRHMYFLRALAARRLSDDILILTGPTSGASSAPAPDNTMYGCLASVLLANYMCDRGNATEAWKVIGSAVRTAQALDLHRDTALWNNLSRTDQELRKITWSLLSVHDRCCVFVATGCFRAHMAPLGRLLSFVVGKPPAVRVSDFDVPLPKFPVGRLPDNDTEWSALHHAYLAKLADIIGDISDKV